MKKYEIHFTGRQNTAIGSTYPITETVEAKTLEGAILKLYDKYEHIRVTGTAEIKLEQK